MHLIYYYVVITFLSIQFFTSYNIFTTFLSIIYESWARHFFSHFVTGCEAHDGDDDSKGDVLGSGGTLKPWGWRPMGGPEHHFCPDFAPEPTGMPEPNFSFFFFEGAFSSGLLPGLDWTFLSFGFGFFQGDFSILNCTCIQ